ncbi:MAG: glutathione S-transferase N-terminal domain-containing protein [Alphaproteobacteria bacterium]|nr:glutathione S-transferase N-terminal domain-containing protein [Alphaproteobacteria bacterium]MBU1512995.1 glutathione S-transferase N-terminal domain-containing protein [Alphaproteobacteria bacterium]MBU2095103.1 glutathione S-transferase N-terminal domain-containing protein [Alphaproteobacteria bacterium]MBU2153036.1 glutathione S-transferase N-terminal domain-containing protein [Alphaproteobacteria bacterium]MBU2306354.1 glutathione S-transferase N-terminal domain-containing protein [Alph
MIKLFWSPGSCALASHIALEEAGAPYEAVRTNLREKANLTPEYLALNPKGRVPALVTDQGVLTENVAILAWIAHAFPEARLAPTDPWAFAQAQAFNTYLASTVHVAYAHRMRGYRWADEESSFEDMRRKVPQTMSAGFQLIEDEFLRGPFVLGEAFSICDAYLFTLADWLEGAGVDPKQFPKVYAHRERVRARPAVGKVLAAEAA